MSDHDLEPLADELAGLLRDERARPPVDVEIQARAFAAVQARIGLVGGGGGAGGRGAGGGGQAGSIGRASSAAVRGTATVGRVAGAIGLVLMGAAIGAGVHATFAKPPEAALVARPERIVVVTVPALATASSAAPLAAALEPSALPDAPVEPAAPPPSASTSATPARHDDELAAERALLEVARTAVGRGQSGAAITALEKHAAKFPRARLGEEREALWIQALLLAGRQDEARARASRFKRSFPRSMALPGLEAALGSIP